MGPPRVVEDEPFVDDDLALEYGVEQLAVEQLAAHPAVEPLEVGVPGQAGLLDEEGVTSYLLSQSLSSSPMNSRPLSARM
jgi:hypothetical protein